MAAPVSSKAICVELFAQGLHDRGESESAMHDNIADWLTHNPQSHAACSVFNTKFDHFSIFSLSACLRESHEKERERGERTKYWSIFGSIIGAAIGY